MNIVLFHNGSTLGAKIAETWQEKYSATSQYRLVHDARLDDLERYRPKLVVLASERSSAFERLVLERCRDLKVRVLPVLGRGTTVLLGPLETPGTPGCVTCLQLRFDNTFEHSLLNSIFSSPEDPDEVPLEVSAADILALAETATAQMCAIVGESPVAVQVAGRVAVYTGAGQVEWVPVVPSHDCPRCDLVPDDNPALAKLQFASHTVHNLETLRVVAVDRKLLEEAFVHPEVGYISAVNELRLGDRYVEASAYIYTPAGNDIAGYGSSLSVDEARRSAILEVLERSCGFQAVNRRPVVRGTYSEVKDVAVHPTQFGLHTPQMYQAFQHILEPFAEEAQYSWVWAHSTKRNQPILIPEQTAYYGPIADEKRFVIESSNGCALGGTIEDAVLHGVFEVLERDGFLNMWYAKLPVPELRLGGHCPAQTLDIHDYIVTAGFDVRLFDLSHDLPIPAVCAVAINKQDAFPKVVSGAACHLNPYQAVHGALRELSVQVTNLQQAAQERREEATPMLLDATKIATLHDHVSVAALTEAFPRWAFLLSRDRRDPAATVEEAYADVHTRYPLDSRDIGAILGAVLGDLHERGHDAIVVNQTSVEVAYGGLYAVKVLIPGMTPINFGYGAQRIQGLKRLYELPVQMGYASRVLTPDDLNPDCHPFS